VSINFIKDIILIYILSLLYILVDEKAVSEETESAGEKS